MTKAVIFDLDGTLYDKKGLPGWLVLSQIPSFTVGLLSRERKARKALMGREFPNAASFYEALFGEMVSVGYDIPKIRKWYDDNYMPSMVRVLRRYFTAYPWVERTIFTLKSKGVKVALLSDYGMVEEKLFALGLSSDLFEGGVYAAPETGGLKPSPVPFLAIAERLGLDPKEIIVVGDREDTDGEGAAKAGMKFLLAKGDVPPEIPL